MAVWDAEVAPADRQNCLAAKLGDLFDSCLAKPHRIRPLANEWVRWAGRSLTALCQAWFSVETADAEAPTGTEPDWENGSALDWAADSIAGADGDDSDDSLSTASTFSSSGTDSGTEDELEDNEGVGLFD